MGHTSNPDYELEQFWLSLKYNMINFYKSYSCYNEEIEEIHNLSKIFNNLQKEKKYHIIENTIHNRISYLTFQVIQMKDKYALHILESNIKRWKQLRDKHIQLRPFYPKEANHIGDDQYRDKDNTIYIYISIYKKLCKYLYVDNDVNHVFDNVIEIHLKKSYKCLIDISIKYNLSSIINNLRLYDDFPNYLLHMYNIDETTTIKTKSKKLLDLLQNKR